MTSLSRQRPLALVLGDLNMVRSLGLAGIPCAVAGTADTPAVYSRFTRTSVHWDGDEWEPSERLVDVLLRFGSEQDQPPVLFYQSDTHLILLSRHRRRLGEVFRFVVPDPELVEILVDKGRFQALAERHGLPVPKAQVVDPAAGQGPIEVDLRFPVVVKPVMRRGSWDDLVGSPKALEFQTPAELREMWPAFAAAGIKLMVQEAIAGPETCVESYHVYAERGGDIVADFTGKKVRTIPRARGHSTAVTVSAADDVAALGREIVRELRLEGVAKFDFKRGPDGRLNLFEINPRFSLWHYLGSAAGLNLPAIVYADLAGLPRPKMTPARPGTRWCQPLTDWQAAKLHGVPLGGRLKWLRECEAKTANWDDPLPILISRLRRSDAFRRFSRRVRLGKLSMPERPGISVES